MAYRVSKAARGVLAGVSALLSHILERAALRRSRATPPQRTGFLPGVQVPDDFNEMYADEIQAMFEGRSSGAGR